MHLSNTYKALFTTFFSIPKKRVSTMVKRVTKFGDWAKFAYFLINFAVAIFFPLESMSVAK